MIYIDYYFVSALEMILFMKSYFYGRIWENVTKYFFLLFQDFGCNFNLFYRNCFFLGVI